MDINEMRETMVSEWGLQGLSAEEQDTAIDKIGSILYQSILLRAAEVMDDATAAEFESYTASKGADMDAATALDWMRERVPGFDQIMAEETKKLKEKVLDTP
jgi:hypothetical protein